MVYSALELAHNLYDPQKIRERLDKIKERWVSGKRAQIKAIRLVDEYIFDKAEQSGPLPFEEVEAITGEIQKIFAGYVYGVSPTKVTQDQDAAVLAQALGERILHKDALFQGIEDPDILLDTLKQVVGKTVIEDAQSNLYPITYKITRGYASLPQSIQQTFAQEWGDPNRYLEDLIRETLEKTRRVGGKTLRDRIIQF